MPSSSSTFALSTGSTVPTGSPPTSQSHDFLGLRTLRDSVEEEEDTRTRCPSKPVEVLFLLSLIELNRTEKV
ncbi:hypothetical protein ACFX11_019443 [Malus domestica]